MEVSIVFRLEQTIARMRAAGGEPTHLVYPTCSSPQQSLLAELAAAAVGLIPRPCPWLEVTTEWYLIDAAIADGVANFEGPPHRFTDRSFNR